MPDDFTSQRGRPGIERVNPDQNPTYCLQAIPFSFVLARLSQIHQDYECFPQGMIYNEETALGLHV